MQEPTNFELTKPEAPRRPSTSRLRVSMAAMAAMVAPLCGFPAAPFEEATVKVAQEWPTPTPPQAFTVRPRMEVPSFEIYDETALVKRKTRSKAAARRPNPQCYPSGCRRLFRANRISPRAAAQGATPEVLAARAIRP